MILNRSLTGCTLIPSFTGKVKLLVRISIRRTSQRLKGEMIERGSDSVLKEISCDNIAHSAFTIDTDKGERVIAPKSSNQSVTPAVF